VSLVRVGAGIDHPYGTSNDIERAWAHLGPFKNGKTIVRAAYGILADQPVANAVSPTRSNPPWPCPSRRRAVRLDNAVAARARFGLAPIRSTVISGRALAVVQRQRAARDAGRDRVDDRVFRVPWRSLAPDRNLNQFINGCGRTRAWPRTARSRRERPSQHHRHLVHRESPVSTLWVTANKAPGPGLQFNGPTPVEVQDYNSLNSQGQVIQDAYNPAAAKARDYDARIVSCSRDLRAPFKGNRFAEGGRSA